ncbi:MAG: peptidoglycan editing factor PgeF [Anaerolineaceae bacterium]|nr:peptidoglycan editing factor PgeF [Anaerolineaceae bacterium]
MSHGIFTRTGGVSPDPWSSLNLGGTVGDSRENVVENRLRLFNSLDRKVESLFDVWQIHGTKIICSDAPRPLDAPHKEADAILTDRPGITLFMRFADCVPIFLFDPTRKVIGMVHAGWMGTVNRIVTGAIDAMVNRYGSDPKNIIAGIGPSIGPDHYQIGDEVIKQVKQTFGSDAGEILKSMDGGIHLDLWEANLILLQLAGVQHIQNSGICTYCHIDDWYSHRGEHGKTGRFGAILALPQ